MACCGLDEPSTRPLHRLARATECFAIAQHVAWFSLVRQVDLYNVVLSHRAACVVNQKLGGLANDLTRYEVVLLELVSGWNRQTEQLQSQLQLLDERRFHAQPRG